ncbi:hypothetical protein GCK72_009587 [Caenorhabditis remanei]|uniref:Uncharacterized protein n=1 Tax=Caenorhabditis remanei TaxID=31234 RepID=A0A6A5H2T5_CAERE|nr:hypothetical protein GCK72_009587 [Caenorhabditis remanei]KAF1761331.1 hypothetical protein GCK72_009587 [Caenorhabditis remanei]
MEGGTYKEPWQTKEVLDPGIESDGSISIIENIFEYTVECVYHFILTNHASKQSDIEKLLELYGTIEDKDKEFAEKVLRVQQNCEPNTFREITKKFGEKYLPTFGKPSKQQMDSSRVFHSPSGYLSDGSANEKEISKFVSSSLNEVFDSIFTPEEIKRVVKGLISSLADSETRLQHIGNVNQGLSYEFANYFEKLDPKYFEKWDPKLVSDFHEKMCSSTTNFIGYFALHTIRHHCYVNFDVGKLKFYRREMYEEAVKASKKEAKSRNNSVKSENECKSETMRKDVPSKVFNVKREISTESDDDYCEIIAPSPTSKSKKRRASESTSRVHSSDVAEDEKEMLEELKKDQLPMNFKARFRKLTEQNQMLREQILEYREMISLRIAEKKQKLG